MWEFLSFLNLVLLVACLVHLFRNGRSFWWLLVLIFFPGLGPVAYFIVEILPDLRSGDFRRGVTDIQQKIMTPDARIHALQKSLKESDTVEKRAELAEAYGQANRWSDAVDTFRQCVEGPFGEDPFLLYGFAHACFKDNRHEEAHQALDRINASGSRDKQQQRILLRARIFAGQGRHEEALETYKRVTEGFSGEEARFRFAKLLKDLGRNEEARTILKDIVENARNHSPLYRKENREYFQEARKLLTSMDS